MKKGIQSSAYIGRYEPFESAIAKMKEHGYDCLDYQDLVDTDSSYLFELSPAEFENELKLQRKIIESNGLYVSQVHGPWRYPFHDTSEEERAERFEKMSLAIKGTALLGCKYFVIHNIMPTGEKYDDPQNFTDANKEFFTRLADVAKECGTVICMENMPFADQPIARPQHLLKFVKELNLPNVKICLDTGHCTCLGISPADAVRQIGADYLKVLHIHDNDGTADRHFLPYDGVTDWDDFAKSLIEIGYDGVLSLEATVADIDDKAQRERNEIDLFNRLCRLDLTL